MNIVFVIGIWLSLAAITSLVVGGAIAHGQRRSDARSPHQSERLSGTRHVTRPADADTVCTYRPLSSLEWIQAADRDALDAVLTTRPGVVRRVTTQ